MKTGSISVYLAIVLSVLLSLILTLVEGARINALRLQIECAADMGLNSAFAEYHRELLEQYDLFFIDASYGSGVASIANIEEHIKEYISYNLDTAKGILSAGSRDWMRLRPDGIAVTEYSIAADGKGSVLKRQIVRYMKNLIGLEGLNELIGQSESVIDIEKQEERVSSERENAERDWNLEKEKKSEESEDNSIIDFKNPADEINRLKGNGILNLVLDDMSKISGRAFEVSQYISHRVAAEGTGIPAPHRKEEGPVAEYLLGEYLLNKCSYYQKDIEKGFCRYQLEYVLFGKSSDSENLREAANKLLLLRQISNVIYLWTDMEKMGEADSLAAAISGIMHLPEIQPLVKQTIIFAWAYAESIRDIRKLFSGGKVPLYKQKKDWTLSLDNLFSFKEHLGTDEKGDSGLKYRDYLRIFLFLMNKEDKLFRFMDILEMDIRATKGNGAFRMDACLDSLMAEINISSGYGYHYAFRKFYCYE